MKDKLPTSRVPHGAGDVDPNNWVRFNGNLPKRGTSQYYTETRWPRYRVLSKEHAQQVLQRYHREDCPGKLRKEYIRYYLRNFDSEGGLVDSGLTASLPHFTLPLDSGLAQMMMDQAQSEKSKSQKPIKFALSSAVKKSKPPANLNESIDLKVNNNSTTSTCTVSKTVAEHTSDEGTTAPMEPVTPSSPVVSGDGGRRLGEEPSEKLPPTSTMKSTLKRIAEPQILKRENKRLKTENSDQKAKIDAQELELAKMNHDLYRHELEVDKLSGSVESLSKALEEKELEISALETQSREHEEERLELSSRLQELQKAKMVKEADLQRQRDKFDNMEHSMARLEAEMGRKTSMFEESKGIIRQAVNDKSDLQKKLKEQLKRMDQLQRELKGAESGKASMFEVLKEERRRCEKLQEDKEKKDEFAEAAKRAAARLLYGVNQIYDSLAEDGTDERDDFLANIQDDLGDHYGPLLNWGRCMAEQGL